MTEPEYPLNPLLTFEVAAQRWLESHSNSIRPSTIRCYKQYVASLSEFFRGMRLSEIDTDKIREYQQWRSKRACPTRLNGEIASVLRAVLKHAGLWKHLEEFYKPQRAEFRRAGHSITLDDERRLRNVALSRPKWLVAGHCMIVMLSTTMGFGELRKLRRRDVDMEKSCVTVQEGAKNIYRARTIPLIGSAFESMAWILIRWEKLGGSSEEQYILPHHARRSPEERAGRGHRRKSPPDFNEPMGHIYRAARSILKEAGLDHFRIYDCRVQAITKLLSDPAVSPQVSKEIAGHITQAMQDRYSIQKLDTKRAALEAIESQVQAPPPEPPRIEVQQAASEPQSPLQALIEAEITKQVALALQGMASQLPAPRLLMFPGGSKG